MSAIGTRSPGLGENGHVNHAPSAEVWVALRLLGDFDPAQITEQLGITPSSQFTKGDVIGTGRTYQHSGWFLDSKGAVSADTIGPHLEWLLEIIEPKAVLLAALQATGISSDLDCFWASIGLSGGPWISPASMSRLGALGLPLVVSFYAVER